MTTGGQGVKGRWLLCRRTITCEAAGISQNYQGGGSRSAEGRIHRDELGGVGFAARHLRVCAVATAVIGLRSAGP